MSLNDRLTSIVRTLVPKGVGAVVGWLAMLGINMPATVSAPLETAVTVAVVFVAGSAYYVTARAIETRWPWTGVLLGVPSVPSYTGKDGGTGTGTGAGSGGSGGPESPFTYDGVRAPDW